MASSFGQGGIRTRTPGPMPRPHLSIRRMKDSAALGCFEAEALRSFEQDPTNSGEAANSAA
jgi:hypothetical protein